MPTPEVQVRFVKSASSISADSPESSASILSTVSDTLSHSESLVATENDGHNADRCSSAAVDPASNRVASVSATVPNDATVTEMRCEGEEVRHFEGTPYDECSLTKASGVNGDAVHDPHADRSNDHHEVGSREHAGLSADSSLNVVVHRAPGKSGITKIAQGLNLPGFGTTFETNEEGAEMEQEESRRTSVGSTSSRSASVEGSSDAGNSRQLASAKISSFRLIRMKEQLLVELPASDFPVGAEDGYLSAPALDGASIVRFARDVVDRYRRIPFLRFRLLFIAFLIAAFFVLPRFVSGLLSGIYLSFIIFLFVCVSDRIDEGTKRSTQRAQAMELLKEVSQETRREESGRKVYKGWMNMLNEHYSPHTFHVNTIQTVMVRLDGNLLRISRPERARTKHAFHNDPTLTEREPRMVSQVIYDLAGAQVRLRPHRLARRRWFSRKYPIEIRVSHSSGIAAELPLGRHSAHKRSTASGQTTSADTADSELSSPTSINEYQSTHGVTATDGSEDSSNLLDSPLFTHHTLADVSELDEVGREVAADGYISGSDSGDSDVEHRRSHSTSDLDGIGGIGAPATGPRRWRTPKRPTRNIYLFARSAREKERWFHQLRKACGRYQLGSPEWAKETSQSTTCQRRATLSSLNLSTEDLSNDYVLYLLHSLQFTKHLESIIGEMACKSSEGVVKMDLGRNKWQQPTDEAGREFVVAANLVASRIFYDFCRDPYWIRAVHAKIQSKLSSIHLPYFIETLELSSFDIGTSIPRILKVYSPVVDDWGIWVDFEIKYEGLIKLTLETKINLLKLKETDSDSSTPHNLHAPSSTLRHTPSRYSDEDVPESPETSPDEEFGAKLKHTDGFVIFEMGAPGQLSAGY